MAAGLQLERRPLAAVEKTRVETRVLVQAYRAVCAVGRRDKAQPAALLLGRKVLLLVGRCQACHARLDPDLEEMRGALRIVVELAVQHPRAGAHALHVAGHNRRAVAHRVLVRQRTVEHVAHDLHVAVAVRAEAGARANAILVDHAQRAEAHVQRIVVIGKREAVEGAQPAVVGIASFFGAAQRLHSCGFCGSFFSSSCTFSMSSAFAWVMTCSSALPGSAPACWKRMICSRNTMSVGMERMPKA